MGRGGVVWTKPYQMWLSLELLSNFKGEACWELRLTVWVNPAKIPEAVAFIKWICHAENWKSNLHAKSLLFCKLNGNLYNTQAEALNFLQECENVLQVIRPKKIYRRREPCLILVHRKTKSGHSPWYGLILKAHNGPFSYFWVSQKLKSS